MSTVLHGATRIDESGTIEDAWVLFDGDRISACGTGEPPEARERVDLHGAVVTPGFIDLHGHGGGGHSYDDDASDIAAALAVHRAHGTTRSVLSLVTRPIEGLCRSLALIADLVDRDPLVLGSHLEGPYLARERRGAHDPTLLRDPDVDEFDRILDAARGTLRQVTIAPELPGAERVIDRALDTGAVVAIGHTAADYALTRAAFDRGARILTHAFNGMPGIHHRAPGPVVAAFDDDRVTLELVLDGHHVGERVAALAFHAAAGRIALVTDAMAAAGAPDGEYRLGPLDVTVAEGRAVLPTGSLAGSTLTQDAALRRAVESGIPPVDAVAAVTSVPARALGIDDRFGRLAPGHAADLVVLDGTWAVRRVWAAGTPVGTPSRVE